MNDKATEHTVGIIGGGPAGSTLAAYLAMANIDCVILEGGVFPRPHVGESLTPGITRVFKQIGILDEIDAAGFAPKYGAAWTNVSGNQLAKGMRPDLRAALHFGELPQPGVDRSYTYHVDRAKFDLMLLRHAEKLGATVHERASVQSVEFSESNGDHLIEGTLGEEKVPFKKKVRLVVDASGRKTFLGSRLKLKMNDPVFDQFAIHTWFEDFDREKVSGDQEYYTYIHFLPTTNSWIWQIPITGRITSIGVVTQKKNFTGSKSSREKFFWDCLSSRPDIHALLKQAKQLRPLTSEADYSYAMKQICGDGWLLIGDAARFIDPIFSSGVDIAMNNARLASADIIEAVAQDDFSKARFSTYEATQRQCANNWYEFISLYYRLNILFTTFALHPKYRLDILKLLQGEVYEKEPVIIREMRRLVTAVENNKEHIWHNMLGDLTATAFKPTFG